MGKPYESEIEKLHSSYVWGIETSIDQLVGFVQVCSRIPLYVLGSGGSYTAATLGCLLHEAGGMVAKRITPLQLSFLRAALKGTGILILTGGGRNSDILSAFEVAAVSEPRQLLAMCMQPESPLSGLAQQYGYTSCLEFELPSGKDGFLATNSLIATATLLAKAYAAVHPALALPMDLPAFSDSFLAQLSNESLSVVDRDTFVVLYGGWGEPAAVDAESKLTEAALAHAQVADYRNFAHGRHHWLAKRGAESAVLALVTPRERELADRTLSLLPSSIPILRLETEQPGPAGAIDLLVAVLHLVHLIGKAREIDPGRPGVPSFGRRIYNLRYRLSDINTRRRSELRTGEMIAIARKNNRSDIGQLSEELLGFWRKAYSAFITKLTRTPFGAIVVDYDGTICDPRDRYVGPGAEVAAQLTRLLKNGGWIGIATGRGRSVRTDLCRILPEEYWPRVVVGYYNGADVAPLTDFSKPDKTRPLDPDLEKVLLVLKGSALLSTVAECTERPSQITVEPIEAVHWPTVRRLLSQLLLSDDFRCVRAVYSSHSIDILPQGVSKVAVVRFCQAAISMPGSSEAVLCIGDKGEWPGNDYELLSMPCALSVDAVSPEPSTCWNIAPAGYRGVQAAINYFQKLQCSKGVITFGRDVRGRR